MKRFTLGIILLAVMLAGCLCVSWGMEHLHRPVSQNLEQAAALACAGDLPEAALLAEKAHQDWQQHWRFVAAFADHGPMEEIDALFAALKTYVSVGEEADFAALCSQLARLTEAMADAHVFNWWNLL